MFLFIRDDDVDDDVYYYIRWRLKLEGETENMGVCTKERKGITCLLYTSPSPRDKRQSRMPSSA